jgi:trimeric autotransporter adhesin
LNDSYANGFLPVPVSITQTNVRNAAASINQSASWYGAASVFQGTAGGSMIDGGKADLYQTGASNQATVGQYGSYNTVQGIAGLSTVMAYDGNWAAGQNGLSNTSDVQQGSMLGDVSNAVAMLDQVGTGNSINVNQYANDASALVAQNGDFLHASITQTGAGAVAGLMQTGNSNSATITQATAGAVTSLVQAGTGNSIIVSQ